MGVVGSYDGRTEPPNPQAGSGTKYKDVTIVGAKWPNGIITVYVFEETDEIVYQKTSPYTATEDKVIVGVRIVTASGGKTYSDVREYTFVIPRGFGTAGWRTRDAPLGVYNPTTGLVLWKDIPVLTALSGVTNKEVSPIEPLFGDPPTIIGDEIAWPKPKPVPITPAPIPHPLPLPPPLPAPKKPPVLQPQKPIKGNPGLIWELGPLGPGPDRWKPGDGLRDAPGLGAIGGAGRLAGVGGVEGGVGVSGSFGPLGPRSGTPVKNGGSSYPSSPSGSPRDGSTGSPSGDRPGWVGVDGKSVSGSASGGGGTTGSPGEHVRSGHTGGAQTSQGNASPSKGRGPVMKAGRGQGGEESIPGDDDYSPEMPSPVTEAVSLSRDPFIAAQQAKALGFAGRTISTPNGPVLAFPPEGGASATGDTNGTIDWEMLDPVAPYAGGIYEPSGRPRGGGPSRRTRMANQAIEALYPEGSGPGADEDDETLAAISAINTGRPMPAPEAPGDPAAMRFGGNVVAVSTGAAPPVGSPSAGMVVAYSAGVGSPTIVTAAGRAMGFKSSR